MLTAGKVATPATAVAVVVPASVPPPGLEAIVRLTLPMNCGAAFPLASRAVTTSAGVIGAPAVVVVGPSVKTNWLGVPTAISNGVLVPVSPAALPGAALPGATAAAATAASVYPVPALSTLSVLKVALPFTAATVVVPERVPPAGLVPSPIFTLPVNPGTTFPWASFALTCTAGAIV